MNNVMPLTVLPETTLFLPVTNQQTISPQHTQKQFKRTTGEDWRRHLGQIENLWHEYETEAIVTFSHFAPSLKRTSKDYYFYQKLKHASKYWKKLVQKFGNRCHSEVKRSSGARNINCLKFSDFRKKTENDWNAFKERIGELEQLSCLENNEDQSNNVLRTALWPALEGCQWPLHALLKPGIEDDYPTAVNELTD